MQTNTQELSALMQEASTLTGKKNWTRQDERRNAFLLSTISAMKNDKSLTLQAAELRFLNAEEAANGLPQTRLHKRLDAEKRARGIFMQQLVNGTPGAHKVRNGHEYRAGETEGAPMLNAIGTYTGLGEFVPTDLFANVFEMMAEEDVLFDPDGPCTVICSKNANPLRVSMYDDTGNDAVQTNEASAQSSQVLLANPYSVNIGAYSWRTPVHVVSMETFQDVAEAASVETLFERFVAKRFSRGIGKMLLTGGGTGQTLGLLSALEVSGIDYLVSAGAGDNDGVSAAATSIGSTDLLNLVLSVNKEYRESKSAGFLMSSTTLLKINSVIDKMGHPLNIVQWTGGSASIFGFPVYICPSMPTVAAGNISVVFGDLSYWVTRLVWDSSTRVRVLKEAPGLIEKGNYGLQGFLRADGALVWDPSSTSGNFPLNYLTQHS